MIRIKKISDTEFELVEDSEILDRFEKLGILMDKEGSVLLKWGDINRVKKTFEENSKKFRDGGFYDIADDLVLLDISKLDQEEIDKCIDICDYCGKIYKNFISNEKTS